MRRSLQRLALICAALIAAFAGVRLRAQDAPLAPNVFVRGVQTAQSVRYTASFVKPVETAVLANVSVEITLPPNTPFLDMFVSPQVQSNVVRLSAEGAFTLIWQMAQAPVDEPLDVFTFTTARPLSAELEFFMTWQDEAGERHIEDFLEIPRVTVGVDSEGQAALTVPGEFVSIGQTGVQAAVDAIPSALTARVLPADFNPPPEFAGIWWCSLLELSGLPGGVSAQVVVPLRRPLAPFSGLALFHQGPDGVWTPLEDVAVVTADGQHILYTHPGGVVATGGPEEIQPDIVPITDIAIETPVPAEQALLPAELTPTVASENPDLPLGDAASPGSGEGVRPAGPLPTAAVTLIAIGAPSVTPPPGSIVDGSSNTIQLGEVTATPGGDGSVRPIGPSPTVTATAALGSIVDGSSNTIQLGEVTATPGGDGIVRPIGPSPTPTVTLGGIVDGSSNTIQLGEVTATPGGDGSIADGSSNTILLGEVTATPGGDGSVRVITLAPPASATSRPTATSAPITLATPTRTATSAPIVIVGSGAVGGTPLPFGKGGVRVVIVPAGNALQQCQVGGVNCAILSRRAGRR